MSVLRTGARGAVAAGAVALVVGCSSLPTMPGPMPTDFVPSSVGAANPSSAQTGNLSPDGFDAARRMTVRIRNVGCSSLSTGSGFALDATTLLTNRHVVADSADLQISTYDGRDVAVRATTTAALADLAIVRTAEPLPAAPVLADTDPVAGDAVTIVGYPLGGQLTVTSGHVIGETMDPLNENFGEVLVTDAAVEPGSSGSAALDSAGRVVGVVYAKNTTGQSFILPVSTLRTLLADETGFTPSPACTR
ncbi:MAG: S1C family serine protease [Cellulomonas sp.]